MEPQHQKEIERKALGGNPEIAGEGRGEGGEEDLWFKNQV